MLEENKDDNNSNENLEENNFENSEELNSEELNEDLNIEQPKNIFESSEEEIKNDISYPHNIPYKNDNVCKPKKTSSLKLWTSALLFGMIAGSTMLGVEYVGSELIDEKKISNNSNEQSIKNVETYTTTNKTENSTVSTIVDKVMPSIVSVTTKQKVNSYQYFGFNGEYETEGAGSGIIIGNSDTELMILTNNHVVADADSLSIGFINGTSVEGYVKGTNSESDLAIISVPLNTIENKTKEVIKVITIGNSDELKVGDDVIAIGNALGLGQSVTTGVVSALNKKIEGSNTSDGLIQTDAAINQGNSGGALLNSRGELIGVNVAKLSDTMIEGMGFAIPISSSNDIIQDLMTKETKYKVKEEERGYLQITTSQVSKEAHTLYKIPQGIFVQDVTKNGAADKAGIKSGDIITQFTDTKLILMEDLQNELQYHKKGEKVQITILEQANNYKEKTVTVELGEKIEE